MDILNIEILEDGTIKTDSNKISMPNHSNAEGFMQMLARLTGGKVSRMLKVGASLHQHFHKHIEDGHHH